MSCNIILLLNVSTCLLYTCNLYDLPQHIYKYKRQTLLDQKRSLWTLILYWIKKMYHKNAPNFTVATSPFFSLCFNCLKQKLLKYFKSGRSSTQNQIYYIVIIFYGSFYLAFKAFYLNCSFFHISSSESQNSSISHIFKHQEL